MTALLLGLIGLPIGLALDALVVRLAVAPDDLEEAPAAERPSLHDEDGSLVLHHGVGWPAWARRLLLAAMTAGLLAIAAARYDDASHLAVAGAYVCVLLVCAATDILVYRVPNAVTYPAMLGALIAGAALPGANIVEVIAGGLLAGGILFVPVLLTGGVGMGMGDVKLVTFVGLALGFTNAVPALLLMALAGGAVAVFLLVTGLRRRGDPIPYAPFISVGALATLLWQGTAFVRLA